MNAYMKEPQLALRLIEVGLTVAGIVAVITPLALWASWSETVFYTVLLVGCSAFPIFIGLAKVRGYLTGENMTGTVVLGLEAVRRRQEDWDRLQEDDPEIGRRQRSIKGDARREVGFMFRVSFGLILIVGVVFTVVWAGFEMYYGV